MLCKDLPSPLFSELGIKYQQAYDGPYEDLSYSVNGTTVIAAIKDGKITGFGRPVLAVGKKLKQAAERLYEISDDIWYRAYEIDDFAKFLLEKGYKAIPYFTQIIDLSKPEEELHADVRKSYKSLLNKGEPQIIDSKSHPNVIYAKFQSHYPYIHRKVSGRTTRSGRTWALQRQMLISGELFAVEDGPESKGTKYNIRFVKSFGLFIYNNHICYYGVGCSAEGAGSHALIWKAILHAKKLGCRYFEMGEQAFSGDEKLLNISKFKHGFGGKTVMRLDLRKEEK